jgi:hypothetical protein
VSAWLEERKNLDVVRALASMFSQTRRRRRAAAPLVSTIDGANAIGSVEYTGDRRSGAE